MEICNCKEKCMEALKSIRTEKGFNSKNETKNDGQKHIVTQKLQIYSKLSDWNQFYIKTEIEGFVVKKCLAILESTQNKRNNLVIVDTENDLNIEFCSLVVSFTNEILLNVINGTISVEDEKWNLLIPDVFQLIEDNSITSKKDIKKIEKAFDFVTNNQDYAKLLLEQHSISDGFVSISYSDFSEFYKKNVKEDL